MRTGNCITELQSYSAISFLLNNSSQLVRFCKAYHLLCICNAITWHIEHGDSVQACYLFDHGKSLIFP